MSMSLARMAKAYDGTQGSAAIPVDLLNGARYKKYNAPHTYAVRYSRQSLEALRLKYRELSIPAFMGALLNCAAQSKDVRLLKFCPDMIEWSDDASTFMLPDYPEIRHPFKTPSDLRKFQDGFTLMTWYVHPGILSGTPFTDPNVRNDFKKAAASGKLRADIRCIREIERETGIPYLTSILDLTPEHLPYLRSLRTLTNAHLETRYWVSAQDQVSTFFHAIVAPATSTLHMHVNVNQPQHPMDTYKSCKLQDLIELLESGYTGMDLVSEKSIYYGETSALFMQGLPDVNISIVCNPFALRKAPSQAVRLRSIATSHQFELAF